MERTRKRNTCHAVTIEMDWKMSVVYNRRLKNLHSLPVKTRQGHPKRSWKPCKDWVASVSVGSWMQSKVKEGSGAARADSELAIRANPR